ncbi:hypothetical protein [Fusobacterium varium]|uniref:hypothetical protein n=1 Tax=Fusobacterium varium TaxID=856 RepID=UPI0035664FEE
MKKIIFILNIFLIMTVYSSERAYFRPTAVYEVKDPITITSDRNEIDFKIILDGQIGRVSGHTLTLIGTGNMNVEYSLNVSQEDVGLEIIEVSKTTQSNGAVYKYNYTWDTSKSKIKNLKGTVIRFTASYTE